MMALEKSVCCLITALCFLSSCSQDGFPGEKSGGEVETFTLAYTIPDDAVMTRGYVLSHGDESKLNKVTVLFFADDAQGNGTYVGQTSLSLSSLADNNDKLTVTLPTGANVNTTYHLLVVGNSDVPADVALSGKRQGEVRNSLKYTLAAGYGSPAVLPMSGEAVKPAGTTDVIVTLVRAVCRIDLKLKAGQNMTFHGASLWGVRSNIYLFTGSDEGLKRIASATQTTMTDGVCSIYAGSNYEAYDMLNRGVCLIVSVTDTDITYANPALTWYRIDLNVDGEGVQQLLRNHVYTVTVNNVTGPGYSAPECAYRGEEPVEIEVTADISGWKSVDVPTIPIE